MTVDHTVNILRTTGFRLFTVDNGNETLTAIRFDAGLDASPLVALSSSQVVQLRDALGKSEHASVEHVWDR